MDSKLKTTTIVAMDIEQSIQEAILEKAPRYLTGEEKVIVIGSKLENLLRMHKRHIKDNLEKLFKEKHAAKWVKRVDVEGDIKSIVDSFM